MGSFIDITGQQFGNWYVIEYVKEKKLWLCECQCENHTRKLIASADLRKGKSTNCGCMRKQDLTGKQFRHLIVDSYAGDYHWNCHCIECGKQFKVHTYHLEHDNIPNCTHSELHTNVDDITGKQFGDWKVISYAGHKYWNCECQCKLHTKRKVLGKDLRNGTSKSCGLDNPSTVALLNSNSDFVDIKDKQFGEWHVDSYAGNSMWNCTCSCGTKQKVLSYSLRSGGSKSCGHNSGKLKNLKNEHFGDWTVRRYVGDGNWECECICGTISIVSGHSLRSGGSKSCGKAGHKYFTRMKDRRFGKLTVKKYLDIDRVQCQCDCGKIVNVYIHNLLSGGTQSCGCSRSDLRLQTMMRNGNASYRTQEQIDAVKSRENLIKFLNGRKPTLTELAKMLGITYSHLIMRVKNKFEIDDLIDKHRMYSQPETDLYNYISSLTSDTIIRNDRTQLAGKELDIWIPSKRIAIEFNGTYWHSDIRLGNTYHQQKTIQCIQNRIRLIHIFEYEWNDIEKQARIKNFLSDLIGTNKKEIYARNTEIKTLDSETAKMFEETYHLQGSANSTVNLGLYNNDELVGLMTFGKPRFNNNFEWELIRLCYKTGTVVIGGTEKLFKHFINNYKPKSVISYCDISKFDGNTYLKLGFETSQSALTAPNYIWVSPERDLVLTRYQTQKQKLLDMGYEEFGNTETEIMENLDFIKVSDCGNLRFEWKEK